MSLPLQRYTQRQPQSTFASAGRSSRTQSRLCLICLSEKCSQNAHGLRERTRMASVMSALAHHGPHNRVPEASHSHSSRASIAPSRLFKLQSQVKHTNSISTMATPQRHCDQAAADPTTHRGQAPEALHSRVFVALRCHPDQLLGALRIHHGQVPTALHLDTMGARSSAPYQDTRSTDLPCCHRYPPGHFPHRADEATAQLCTIM